jgi:hypothetical protein
VLLQQAGHGPLYPCSRVAVELTSRTHTIDVLLHSHLLRPRTGRNSDAQPTTLYIRMYLYPVVPIPRAWRYVRERVEAGAGRRRGAA